MPNRSEAKLARYRLLVELMAALVRTLRMEDVMAELHSRIGTLFTTPVTLLALRLEDGSWQCLTLEGRDTYRKTLHAQQDGLLERALHGQLTYTNDLFSYAQEHRLTLRSLDPNSNLPYSYSWMGVPLMLEGERAGVLSLQSYTEGAFTDDDLEFLHLLSTHLGIAIENAMLREQLERDALTDALTGLGNRRAFVHCGEVALADTQPLTLAVMDVQGFKRINDDLGHPAGDAVLAHIGALLRRHTQPESQGFRLGGDEFAWLLPLPLQGAHGRLNRFLDAAADSTWPVPVPVRLNVGLAEHRPGLSLDTLIHHADTRMYDAKLRGVQLDPAPYPGGDAPPVHG
ncbi:diguanylate cyclase domain-containing protein [Deinococcus altitudinis]|uniref:diguanylate cyclase domain-containing protein n=1 Tax=Deinococcus altitudinis TaxID=468914 RepID=UPI003891DC24